MANRTRIEWCTHSVNPVKGLCPVDCKDLQGKPYCYARKMYLNPYYKSMHENLEIRLDPMAFTHLPKRPSRIFVGSTMELFGPWVKQWWLESIFGACRKFPQHTFIFLTKRPQYLDHWSPFPANCHIGVSVCNDKMLDVAVDKLEDIEAKVKFISFEPLLERLTLSLEYAFYYSGISWCIIGQRTPPSVRTAPKIEWVRDIVEAADKAGVAVFLKDNLRSLLPTEMVGYHAPWAFRDGKLRQEWPR